jgi:hypothetical protein
VIIRVFRAPTYPGREDEFERFVWETGVPLVEADPLARGPLRTTIPPVFTPQEGDRGRADPF